MPRRRLLSITNPDTTTTASSSVGPVTAALEQKIRLGLVKRDEAQRVLASKLDVLHQALTQWPSQVHTLQAKDFYGYPNTNRRHNPMDQAKSLARQAKRAIQRAVATSKPPRGLYIHGSVGIGKSFMMDLFYDQPIPSTIKSRRVHFHEFVLEIHEKIHRFKQQHPKTDALPHVALEIAQESQLLCFDEFQVTDIADAMILKRLFELLWEMGVVVVSTSNRPPETLYEGGLNRALFLPFIDSLQQTCDVFSMDTTNDYRRDKSKENDGTSYFSPNNDPLTRSSLETIFSAGSTGDQDGASSFREEVVPIRMGRRIHVQRANDSCGWFEFNTLCHQPLGAADYLALANRFSTIIIENVPQLDARYFNEARRFVTMIDTFYESKTRLVIAADVPLQDLFVDFEASVETNDGDEEIAVPEESTSFIKGEGGSSSSNATTMIRTKDGEDMEWSATGRVGVSLAQLSAAQDVVFSFRRAESRLVQMSGKEWNQ